jgi:ParB family chromosome partitioning protein
MEKEYKCETCGRKLETYEDVEKPKERCSKAKKQSQVTEVWYDEMTQTVRECKPEDCKPRTDVEKEQMLKMLERQKQLVDEMAMADKYRAYVDQQPKSKYKVYALGEWGKKKVDREAKVHRIKCTEPFFTDIDKELKTFELRKNDRDYRRHDFLELMQYVDGKETGKHIYAYIEYLLEGFDGIQEGYCIMGIERIRSNTSRDKRWREDNE